MQNNFMSKLKGEEINCSISLVGSITNDISFRSIKILMSYTDRVHLEFIVTDNDVIS